jgi:hypothetical protein
LDDLRARDAAGQLRLRVNANLPVNFGDEKVGFWFSTTSRDSGTARSYGWPA